eukprot:CAMPEP_0194227194 /NCGR_PEP_ID=MMETSP0156-20130528/42737_1 /TAXON_ID=33649 /ORGANISM="Thalassionema nitzschioides, Strain L26-B" /LENGTH=650 /DNA_ID=CAMNT_0038959673 /DNA_START=279 /DNA_END=2229 /DNA_ORIENTATION=-
MFRREKLHFFTCVANILCNSAVWLVVVNGNDEECSETCGNDFRFRCLPYHCEQDDDKISIDEAWIICRDEIDDALGPLAEVCTPGCGDTSLMTIPFECSCDNIDQCESDERAPDDEEGDDGDEVEPVFPLAWFSLEPSLLTPSSLLLCSETCANAFTFGCMPYHCEQGQSIDEAWTTCRGEIDDGLGPLAEEEVGCIPGCGNTVTMSMAFECGCDNIDQCESDEGTPDDEEGDDGDEVEPVFPYGLVFPRTVAGTTLSGTYGKIYIIGDSLLDGTGSTQGVVEEKIAEILSTTVVNNAVGGFPLEAIAKVPSCSQDVDCKWTIINGGINRDVDLSQVVSRMTGLVEREVATGRKVILQGYPRDCPEAGLAEFISGDFFEAMHDAYVSLAAGKANVWMVDSRNHPLMGDPCNPASRPYRAEDNSHPSPLAGQVFAEEAIKIIMANLDEATLAPVSLTPVSLAPVSSSSPTPLDEENEAVEEQGEVTSQPTMQGIGPLCLSGDSTVHSLQRGTIPLSMVQLGESIFVGNGKYEPVYSFGHFGPNVRNAKMLRISTDSGTIFSISENHLIFTETNEAIPASQLTVGSRLQSSDHNSTAPSFGVERIKSIQNILSNEGVYAPFTPSGKFVVGGTIVVSCYVAMFERLLLFNHHW